MRYEIYSLAKKISPFHLSIEYEKNTEVYSEGAKLAERIVSIVSKVKSNNLNTNTNSA